MKILGLQKLTLLDFPGKVACTVFLNGCNFRCPFCHNSELLEADTQPIMETEEFLTFLKRRQGILDGVCITGGEPTLHSDLLPLLRQIRAMGFQIKLDTNGYRPEVLRAIVTEGLTDYVAMDVKNGPQQYGYTIGLPSPDLKKLEESIYFLMENHVDYELRTTVAEPLHDDTSIRAMCQWLLSIGDGRQAKRLFVQPFVDRDTVPTAGLRAPDIATLTAFIDILKPCAEYVALRGE